MQVFQDVSDTARVFHSFNLNVIVFHTTHICILFSFIKHFIRSIRTKQHFSQGVYAIL